MCSGGCGGSVLPPVNRRGVTGGATGAVSMRRGSAPVVWVVECPDGGTKEVTGDGEAYRVAAACGGSYSPK